MLVSFTIGGNERDPSLNILIKIRRKKRRILINLIKRLIRKSLLGVVAS
jgi:hypothetical protein